MSQMQQNEDSLLFSSFNSEMYRNLNNGEQYDLEEFNKYKMNYSYDLTSMKSNNNMNVPFNGNNMQTINSTNNNAININMMANENQNAQVNIDKSIDKTEQTECQYDDIIFHKNENFKENNKIINFQLFQNNQILSQLNNSISVSGYGYGERLLAELDSTYNLNDETSNNIIDTRDRVRMDERGVKEKTRFSCFSNKVNFFVLILL